MKKVMVLATVAMMGMGGISNVSAVSMSDMSSKMSAAAKTAAKTAANAAAKLMTTPIIGEMFFDTLKDATLNKASGPLKLDKEEKAELSQSFDSIINILRSKAHKHTS